MDLDKLRLFHAAVEAGSFTQAAEDLDVNQSTVSRQIHALEEDLGTSLFQRHARGLHLTEQGELLHRATKQIFGLISDTKAQLLETRETPKGLFKVTATVCFGAFWLMPRIKHFIEAFPDIETQVLLDDQELNLGQREADVAIRMRQPVEPDLIMRRLFEVKYHIYASYDYLKRHGEPASLRDLDRHSIIIYGDAPIEIRGVNWLAQAGREDGSRRKPALTVNHLGAMLHVVEAGAGLACLPDYLAHGNDKLKQIMCEVEGPRFDVHMCYPESLKGSKRVGVFREFLVQQARDWRF